MFTDPLNSIHGSQVKSYCSKHEQMKWVEQNLAARWILQHRYMLA